MPRMMRSVEVNVSPNKVREFLWDAERMSNYMPVTEVEAHELAWNEQELRFALDYGDGPVQIRAIMEMDKSARKLKCRATEGMVLEQTWVLQQTKQGTQITYIVDYEPTMGGLAGMLLQGRSRKRMFQTCCASLERLRYHLEREPEAKSPEYNKPRDLAA